MLVLQIEFGALTLSFCTAGPQKGLLCCAAVQDEVAPGLLSIQMSDANIYGGSARWASRLKQCPPKPRDLSTLRNNGGRKNHLHKVIHTHSPETNTHLQIHPHIHKHTHRPTLTHTHTQTCTTTDPYFHSSRSYTHLCTTPYIHTHQQTHTYTYTLAHINTCIATRT